MKYKYIRDRLISMEQEVKLLEEIIEEQRVLIDQLTSQKIQLLSDVEILKLKESK